MSALYDAEEADREAAERLRVDEWAAEHQNPVTAALQRAEHAEERARRAEAKLAALEDLRVEITHVLGRPAKFIVKRGGHVIFSGVDYTAALPNVQLLGHAAALRRDGGDRS